MSSFDTPSTFNAVFLFGDFCSLQWIFPVQLADFVGIAFIFALNFEYVLGYFLDCDDSDVFSVDAVEQGLNVAR